MPLIVMLHGCTQDPDDFAAGTRMNDWAEEAGLLVIYPAQSANANGAKCWNWFNPEHQVTDRGEPSLIAGMTREVASIYAVDTRRIFVAGLSAGAAMAVVLGETYPDLFAGVGAHSGLPYGAAYDIPSALAAMRGCGEADGGQRSRSGAPISRAVSIETPPTIVFHGDRDATVNCANASAIVSRAATSASQIGRPLNKTVRQRQSANGRQYTTTLYRDAMLRTHIEEWVLHGSGHAWSGGSSAGSYTDVSGPDASAEMLRFFFAQLLGGPG
jgi:poly(hydroxyalkanoate) depolymerase family esterase